jgi:malonyl-CoA O-methyltransferase
VSAGVKLCWQSSHHARLWARVLNQRAQMRHTPGQRKLARPNHVDAGGDMGPIYWALFNDAIRMSDEINPSLDQLAAQRCMRLRRDASPWLNEEIAQRMHARLSWMAQPPKRWAHWMPHWGGLRSHDSLKDMLAQANGRAKVHTYLAGPEPADATSPGAGSSWLRSAWQALRRVDARWQHGDEPLDMVWANMALHMQAQPLPLLMQWLSMLRVDGMVMFSALGPDTLRELREVYAHMAWDQPTHLFTDMHDWGDMLVQCGFADPVMDMETLTITYATLDTLLRDLRECGRNLNVQRAQHCFGRGWEQTLRAALEQHLPRNSDGHFVLSVEIIYGHALRAQPKVLVQAQTSVPLADMQRMLRRPKT